MSQVALLRKVEDLGITLRADGERLSIIGDTRLLADAGLMASLKANKPELLRLLTERARIDGYRIPEGTSRITPEMLPLVTLTQEQIDAIAGIVQGGTANIQDVYPLLPLQEGILFHHRLHTGADAYVLPTLLRFDSRERLDRFVRALNEVVARHDILRTSVHWEGLAAPVQVVWREARVEVEEIASAQSLTVHEGIRLDLGRAPLLRGHAAFDEAEGKWLLRLLHHHLVLDHTASELLVREVMLILQNRREALPRAVPFRGFVARARQGTSSADHEAYFREHLGDVDAPTAPFGLLDVQGDGSGLARSTSPLDADLARRVRLQARARGVSAACLFHLAWARVLASCTGRDDVVFGTVLFGRMQGGADAGRAMGMFLNTLPLRVRLAEDTVEQAVKQVHGSLVDLLRHEYAPLSLAQRCSAVPANLPLFTSLLNYRYGHGDGERGIVLDGIEHLGGDDRTNYPFVLDIDDLGEGFALTAETHGSIEPARIRDLMACALSSLVAALEQAPQTRAIALETLHDAERRQVIDAFNARDCAEPPAMLAHALFERQVALRPDGIALEHDGAWLRYGELNGRANRLAHYLRGLGVGPDERVAICMERGLDMVVAVLATLKAGGVYVPIDPAYPDDRIAHMLADSAPVVLLTQHAVRERLVPRGCAVVTLEGAHDEAPWAEAPGHDPDPAAVGLLPSHGAYVIYTSGSTGTPKGVLVEHRQLCHQVAALGAEYAFLPEDRVLQFSALSFDVAGEEIFGALLHGATLVLRTDAWLTDPAGWCALCEQHGLTIANLPTLFWQRLALEPSAVIPSRLRQIIIGGDAVSAASLEAWWRREGYRPALANAYGPTETTINATIARCAAEDPANGIGRPVANARVYVLDARRQPVPVGAVGELWIGGAGVARGYLGRPELTAERFVKDPFVADERARMYRSGDLGRWRADGSLEFLGRNDFQVKIRGFRIELGEIETQLAQLDGIGEAAVLAREGAASHGEKRLVAYVVGAAGAPRPDPGRLRAALAERLPDYMVPAAYVVLDALPLMANGKLDRKALPAPDGDAYTREAYEAPAGEIEETLARIWSELLGVERVSRHDSFFELGGHSLLAVQLMERLRRQNWTIDVRVMFTQPALAAMAAAVRVEQDAECREVEVPRNAIPAEFAPLAEDEETEELRL